MSDLEERAWLLGKKAAYERMLNECLLHLGPAGQNKHSWASERTEAIAVLRQLCAEYGDNDWEDGLHVADIITKHLGRYLEQR